MLESNANTLDEYNSTFTRPLINNQLAFDTVHPTIRAVYSIQVPLHRTMCHGNLNAASKPADTSDNPSCPFNIRQLNSTTYLVREHDSYVSSFDTLVKVSIDLTAAGRISSHIRQVVLTNKCRRGSNPGHPGE